MPTPTLMLTSNPAHRRHMPLRAVAPLIVLVAELSGCGGAPVDPHGLGASADLGIVHQGLSLAGPVQVGFNAPEGLDDPLAADLTDFIAGAAVRIDAALYKLTHGDVVEALLQAHARGIAVRMVSDTKHRHRNDAGPVYDQLEAAGIPIVYDERKSDMHNKFLVRDGFDVWLGSYNPLQMAATHAEDALTITSADVAEAFTIEFEEMFVERKFTRAKTDNTEHEFVVDGARLEAYFAPKDGVEERVVQAIEQAQHSVRFLAFSFSADPIADALLARMDAGVEVIGAIDNLQATKRGGDFTRMLDAGMDVRRTPFLTMMHHKFLVIDAGTADAKVITGSYNFTRQADHRNDESVVVIHSSETAHAYLAAFNLVFERCARLNTDGVVGQDLRITEIHANPLDEVRGEFVEFVNASDEEASVLGLYLSDGDAWDRVIVADGGPATLAPWQVAVILDPDHDGVAPPVADGARRFTVENGTLGDGLTNNDPVSLFGPDRQIPIDTFSYPSNPGNGRSIYRTAADAPDEQDSWAHGAFTYGTAGIFPEPAQDPWSDPSDEVDDPLININTASDSALTALPRIGPSTAARIVADRDANGVFCSLDALARVRGIGPSTVAGISPHATVGPDAELPAGCTGADDQADPAADLIDINTADGPLLDTLPGIGPSTASRILGDRAARGAFSTPDEITRVSGIGPKTYSRIADLITALPVDPAGE